MATFPRSALVRIYAANSDKQAVGAGVFVSAPKTKLVLTCAHVVAAALAPQHLDSQTKPTTELVIDFPLIEQKKTCQAKVVVWMWAADLAALEILTEPPAAAQAIACVSTATVRGHKFQAFGFPGGHPDGVWASGELTDRNAAGQIQIEDTKVTGHRVQPGFSGGPVWDESLNAIVGIVVSADRDPAAKAAYLIPIEQMVKAGLPLPERECPQSNPFQKWLALFPFIVVVGLLFFTLWYFSQPPPTFDFENKSKTGWDVRWEGDDRLGVTTRVDDDFNHSGFGQVSLRFQFELQSDPPYNKAQVKYESIPIVLTERLAAWLYVPATAPSDLQASCFVLEHNESAQASTAEWVWYQTGYTALKPMDWTFVNCPIADFAPSVTGAHWATPLLTGFEITRTRHAPYKGVVYLDDVILR